MNETYSFRFEILMEIYSHVRKGVSNYGENERKNSTGFNKEYFRFVLHARMNNCMFVM